MKKIGKILIILLVLNFVGFVSVARVYAVDPPNTDQNFIDGKSYVPCGNEKTPVIPASKDKPESGGDIKNPCTINSFFQLINRVVHDILFKFAVPIAAIMFVYAGFLLLFSGGDSHKRATAKSIFINVGIGLIIVAGSWLIIHTILSILGYNGLDVGFS